MTKFSRIFLDRRHSGVTTLLYILIQYYNKINEKKKCTNARVIALSWREVKGCVCSAICIIYKYKERKREIVMTERARKDMWRRKCFFYMIINVSITQRHRHMVLKITYILSYSLKSFHQNSPLFPAPQSPLSQAKTIPCSRIARAIFTLGDEKRMTRKKRRKKQPRGCAVEINVVALTRASPYRRYHYYILTDAFLLLHYIVCC